ncbi:MAG: hypothetical protein IJ800_05710 [Clostridia bacterium]|nr:hypothetical protein [Clostridia bacterium]
MGKKIREKMSKAESEVKRLENIEKEFFEIDEEAKLAKISLSFLNPSSVFDLNYVSKKPVFSDDFTDWIKSAFDIVPSKYKIDLEVEFEDMQGFKEDELLEIFKLNTMLEYRTLKNSASKRNKIALGLLGVGAVFFVIMLVVNRVWTNDSLFKQIFSYVSDIATTVTFWEALTILVVENKEDRDYRLGLLSRFHSISFHRK